MITGTFKYQMSNTKQWSLPDLPTPALPNTASLTSGLLAMTATVNQTLSSEISQPSSAASKETQTESKTYLNIMNTYGEQFPGEPA